VQIKRLSALFGMVLRESQLMMQVRGTPSAAVRPPHPQREIATRSRLREATRSYSISWVMLRTR
jgi:hypothetical protein